jgi:hypothetical protein
MFYPSVYGVLHTVTIEETISLSDAAKVNRFRPFTESLETSDSTRSFKYRPLKEVISLIDGIRPSSNKINEFMSSGDAVKPSSNKIFVILIPEDSVRSSANVIIESVFLLNKQGSFGSYPAAESMEITDGSLLGLQVGEGYYFNDRAIGRRQSQVPRMPVGGTIDPASTQICMIFIILISITIATWLILTKGQKIL